MERKQAPRYHVIAAGSLLGVSLSHGDSFPVGKVDFLRMYPVTFREFLYADNRPIYDYLESVTSVREPLPEIVMGRASESFRRYLVCGGMPAAAVSMLAGEGVTAVETIQKNVLMAYSLDFSKHAPTSHIPRIAAIWQSIPSQLARENRKFLYKLVKPGARAREYEDALLWLQHGTHLSPIEVKAGESLNGKSLAVYTKHFQPDLAIRYSGRNLKRDGSVLNLPLFMADWTGRLCAQMK